MSEFSKAWLCKVGISHSPYFYSKVPQKSTKEEKIFNSIGFLMAKACLAIIYLGIFVRKCLSILFFSV